MNLLLLVLSSLVIIIVPWPDILFVLSQWITLRQRAGAISALGLSVGVIVHTNHSIWFSNYFQTSEIAFILLQYCGLVYLLYRSYIVYSHKNIYINISVDSYLSILNLEFEAIHKCIKTL